MLYNRHERGKVRQNISLVQQYIKQVFPHNIDHRQLFLFLAFELHPGFEELAFLLQMTVEALELVKQVHSQRYTTCNPNSNLSKYLEHGPGHFLEGNRQEEESLGVSFVYTKLIHKQSKRFTLAKKLAACIISGGECTTMQNDVSEKRALSLLFHHSLPTIAITMQSDIGYSPSTQTEKLL